MKFSVISIITLRNVLVKFALQAQIKDLKEVSFTIFFAISTNCVVSKSFEYLREPLYLTVHQTDRIETIVTKMTTKKHLFLRRQNISKVVI